MSQSQATPTEPPTKNAAEPTTPPALPIEPMTATLQPQPAGYHDLKSALPVADAEFLASQLESNATVAQAQAAWMAEQNRRLESVRKEAEEAKTADEAAAKKPGVNTLGNGGTLQAAEGTGDPIARFDELVATKVAAGKPKARAISDVIAEYPELHEEYLAAYNAEHKK